ncbi:MAG: hypothetical protein R3F11_17405 [Verrucomicrobiales bacterium]
MASALALASMLIVHSPGPAAAKGRSAAPPAADSYTLIANPVWDRADQTGLQVGWVTVRSYASGGMAFDSANLINGWIASVKSSGGTSAGDRVVVVFFNPLNGGQVKFMIEPGRLVIR